MRPVVSIISGSKPYQPMAEVKRPFARLGKGFHQQVAALDDDLTKR